MKIKLRSQQINVRKSCGGNRGRHTAPHVRVRVIMCKNCIKITLFHCFTLPFVEKPLPLHRIKISDMNLRDKYGRLIVIDE